MSDCLYFGIVYFASVSSSLWIVLFILAAGTSCFFSSYILGLMVVAELFWPINRCIFSRGWVSFLVIQDLKESLVDASFW